MRLFGFEFGRAKAIEKGLSPPGGSWTTIYDYNTGTWQQDSSINLDTVLTFGAVFACLRLISSDIGKLKIKLLEKQASGIWSESFNQAYSPILRKPNSIQTRIKFIEQWVMSKLQYGNAYILKGRDQRGVVNRAWVLDANRVSPLVSDSGDVFYRLRVDHLAQVHSEIIVPAREIMHDVHIAPVHPLIGVSPIGACGLAATQGLKIQSNSKNLFTNGSRPAGVLTAPGKIADETAARLKTSWEANYGGENYGKTAVLGDGLAYQPIAVSASDAQLIEQLNWTGADVCRAFGVPAYKIGVGPMPAYNNVEALDQAYYSQTLQELIECIEALLDEGLGLTPGKYSTEFDLDRLLRMDSMTSTKVKAEKIKAGYMTPNEARRSENLEPVDGGDSPYLQQQNFSLAALAKRDASEDPFASSAATPPTPEPEPEPDEPAELNEFGKSILQDVIKGLAA